jgi:LmbE family N-acetylglucosaminyl deacetylase
VEILSEIPNRALAIYAHPDDADVSCGGTLALWSAGGCEIHLVVCAGGDKGSSDPLLDADTLMGVREREVETAQKHLGIKSVDFLRIPDGEVVNDIALRRKLVNIIRGFLPEVVISPDPTAIFFGEHYYNHRDHRETGWAALDAVSPAAFSPLYFKEEGSPHKVSYMLLSGTLAPSVFVDIARSIDRKERAISSHVSQLGDSTEWLRSIVRERAKEAFVQTGIEFSEGFRRMVF